jgi:uncharacterized membrane protein HdeD (DUF308 family)
MTSATATEGVGRLGYPWWLLLVLGIAWLIFGFVILTFDFATVLAIAYFAGVVFIASGISELVVAFVVPGWRWVHLIVALLAIGAGIVAFAWPGKTFVVLAAILAWYLLFDGTFKIIAGFLDRHDYDLWWLSLLVGVVEVAIAFWAIGYPGRSLVLLVLWVGAAAICRGIGDIFLAFRVKDLAAGPPLPPAYT